jgi:hypothetical protein
LLEKVQARLQTGKGWLSGSSTVADRRLHRSSRSTESVGFHNVSGAPPGKSVSRTLARGKVVRPGKNQCCALCFSSKAMKPILSRSQQHTERERRSRVQVVPTVAILDTFSGRCRRDRADTCLRGLVARGSISFPRMTGCLLVNVSDSSLATRPLLIPRGRVYFLNWRLTRKDAAIDTRSRDTSHATRLKHRIPVFEV